MIPFLLWYFLHVANFIMHSFASHKFSLATFGQTHASHSDCQH